jgi:hypothetical protein
MGAARIDVMGARRSSLEEGLAEEVGVSASTKLIEVVTEVPAKEPALLQQSSCSRALILVKMPNPYCKSVPCYSSVTLVEPNAQPTGMLITGNGITLL